MKIWSSCWCWMDTGVVDDSKRLWEKNKISREGTIWRGIQCSGKIKWSAVQSFSQILLRDPLGYCFFCYGVNFIMMLLDWRECWRKWGQGNDYAKLWIDCIWLMLETWILILRRRPYLIIVRHWAYDFVTTDGQPQKYWQTREIDWFRSLDQQCLQHQLKLVLKLVSPSAFWIFVKWVLASPPQRLLSGDGWWVRWEDTNEKTPKMILTLFDSFPKSLYRNVYKHIH